MKTYIVTVPPTAEQGSYKTKARASYGQTMRGAALQDYNSCRAHDGFPPVSRMPAGTKYTPQPPAPKFVANLACFNSKADAAENCYYAFTWTDNGTGKTVGGKISGGESNVRGIMFEMNGGSWEPHNVFFTTSELPIREFNRAVKGWNYAGCRPADLVEFIKKGLAA
jgi:hypothetical protein